MSVLGAERARPVEKTLDMLSNFGICDHLDVIHVGISRKGWVQGFGVVIA